MLESTYIELINKYEVDSNSVTHLWNEIKSYYSKPGRHYHNLKHLEDLLTQLIGVKDRIDNWDVILFSLYYHDIIYKATKRDNEEKSAEIAVKRLSEIGVKEQDIALCFDQIIATKTHKVSDDLDTNFFTDADLSILGRSSDKYKLYCEQIRKEYTIYPDFLYNRGRKQVIKHFLGMPRIYKSEVFYNRYEEQAKVNLREELIILGG